MKTLILLLICGPCMAQTYDVNLNLGGVTYSGSFDYSPTYDINPGGQTVTLGNYTNVLLSDPYAGTLTSINDPYDGNNVGQHDLWFLNAANRPVGLSIPDSGIVGPTVQVISALAYVGPGSLDYVTCSPCDASITEVQSFKLTNAPELDPANGIAATTLLGCIVLILRAGRSGEGKQ